MKDPIVEEVREAREEHAARFKYDVDAIFEDLKKLDKDSGDTLVSLPPKLAVKLRPTADVR